MITTMLRLSCALMASACATSALAELPLHLISLPDGFEISIYAEDVRNARSMARTPDGTLFVGTRRAGMVHALADTDGDGLPETRYTIAEELHMPNGVAFRDGALYVAEVSRIVRYDDIEANLESPPEPVVLIDTLPTEEHHGWKYLDFGPDGRLYFNIGAPCNICNMEEEDARFATIASVAPDGSDFQIFAKGVRNTVGFTWHPTTQEMWFTDNGRDWLGDDRPPCELNHASARGQHFGYPYVHGSDLLDPQFAADRTPDEFRLPVQDLGPHVAPLGLLFYTGDSFPEAYSNDILIAEHGSWNRSIPIGYRIMRVTLDGNGQAASYEDFASGWLQRGSAWGRPVDVLQLPDGSILVSDDKADVIYRIAYTGGGSADALAAAN